MAGQLCWLPKFGGNGQLILHLRLKPYEQWKPYTAFPEFSVPDYPIANGSRGWATNQKLLKAGWTLIPTQEARKSFGNSTATEKPVMVGVGGRSQQ
jgi:hypothetical protein